MPISSISKTEIKESESVKGYEIRSSVFNLIKKDFPEFEHNYVEDLMKK